MGRPSRPRRFLCKVYDYCSPVNGGDKERVVSWSDIPASLPPSRRYRQPFRAVVWRNDFRSAVCADDFVDAYLVRFKGSRKLEALSER